MSLFHRFAAKVCPNPLTDCWDWTGHKMKSGYATFWTGATKETIQRVSYQLFVGPIPDGFEVHHKCRNRGCANPKHLEAKTKTGHLKEHEPDLLAMTKRREEKRTHCKRGHPLFGGNLYAGKGRRCATCARDDSREYQRLRRQKLHLTN